MNCHIIWAITGDNGAVSFTKDGRLCCYRTQSDAVVEMADLMKQNPEKNFILRQTKVLLPWSVN